MPVLKRPASVPILRGSQLEVPTRGTGLPSTPVPQEELKAKGSELVGSGVDGALPEVTATACQVRVSLVHSAIRKVPATPKLPVRQQSVMP